MTRLASFLAQRLQYDCQLTNCDWLDADSFLDMGVGRVIGILGFQHLLSTECVDEGRASCRRQKIILALLLSSTRLTG